MLRLRVVALASGIVALALGTASAQTAPADDPASAQPAPTDYTTTPPPAPAPTTVVVPPAQEIHVETAPATETIPAPVIEEHPVNVTIVQPQPRPRNMSVSLGGGVSNFFDQTMQNRAGVQGAYEARLGFGVSSMLGVEAAYVGTAGPIDTLGLDDSAVLVSNGIEGLGRINLTRGDVQPFIVGGGSWVRYNVTNKSFNTSDIRNQDDVFELPVGAGVAAYIGNSGLMLDGRFVYRHVWDDELVRPTPGNSDGSSLNNWVATLRLGYTF